MQFKSPAQAGPTSASCTGPCPNGFQVSPRVEKPVPVLSHPHSRKVFPAVQRESLVFQVVPITAGPVTGHH